MSERVDKVLLIGFGNPGRRDDGLGPALAAAVERLDLPGVTVDADYQLTVEDAAAVAEHDAVVFADASVDGAGPFSFRRIGPGDTVSFSTHHVSPEGVIGLAEELFAAQGPAYVLGIRGYNFDGLSEGLSPRGRANLRAAVDFIVPVLRERAFDDGVERVAALATSGVAFSREDGRPCKTEST